LWRMKTAVALIFGGSDCVCADAAPAAASNSTIARVLIPIFRAFICPQKRAILPIRISDGGTKRTLRKLANQLHFLARVRRSLTADFAEKRGWGEEGGGRCAVFQVAGWRLSGRFLAWGR